MNQLKMAVLIVLLLVLNSLNIGCNNKSLNVNEWKIVKIEDFKIKLPEIATVEKISYTEGKFILDNISIKYSIVGFDVQNLNPSIYPNSVDVTVDSMGNYNFLKAFNIEEGYALMLVGYSSDNFLFPNRTDGLKLYADKLKSNDFDIIKTIFDNVSVEE